MLRIERKQWSFVVALIALTMAAGVFIVTAGFNVSVSGDQALGNGTHLLFGPASSLPEAEEFALESFQAADVVRLSQAYPTGSATPVTIKSLGPDGSNVAPLIALLDGRFPTAPGEIAGTKEELDRLGVGRGDTIDLDDVSYVVVGVVENPQRLGEQFFLAPPRMERFDSFEMLVTTTDEAVEAFSSAVEGAGRVVAETDNGATSVLLAAFVLGALLEVALLSIAVITVLAQRRVRQLGVLAAVGAGQRQVRAAVVAGGVVAGLVAVSIGVVAGVVVSLLAVPSLDTLAGRRIESVHFPWVVIAALALIGLGSAVLAAWWPARKLSALTVASSLRARRPEAVRPVKMTLIGLALIGAGVVSLLAVFSMSPVDRPIYFDVASFVAIPVGAVFLAPAAVRLAVRAFPKPSLVARVAISDVGRYQSRSAATTAALVIILTIPVVAAVGFHTVERSPSNVPTVPKDTVWITSGFRGPPGFAGFAEENIDITGQDELAQFGDAVAELGQRVGADTVALLEPVRVLDDVVLGVEHEETSVEVPITAGIVDSQSGRDFTLETVPTYVATPELTSWLGLDMADLDGNDVVTNRRGRFAIVEERAGDAFPNDDLAVSVIDFDRYTATPGALLSPGYVETAGLPVRTTGWLLTGADDFTADELAELREGAGRIGLGIVVHQPGIRGGAVVTWAIVIAALVAMGIVAIVGALHRTETADVDVAYQSVGAPARFRRKVHAVTIAALVFVAALLATAGGLLSQVGFASEQLGFAELWRMIPPLPLLAIVIVIPAVAYAVSWFGVAAERDGPLPQHQFG